MFDVYLKKWRLIPDGKPLVTYTSRLLPVRFSGKPAMLKVAVAAEEKRGALLMQWWNGKGAAHVLAADDDALVLERAEGGCLSELAINGRDDEACRIICRCVAELHASCNKLLPSLLPLEHWFRELFSSAPFDDPTLALAATVAGELLADPQDIVALHGDIHHANILHFGAKGWLAIDPKGLIGERGFDYANLFCNPDPKTATDADLFIQRLQIVSETAGLERERLLKWIIAWAGLSAVWFLDENLTEKARSNFAVIRLAARQLPLYSSHL